MLATMPKKKTDDRAKLTDREMAANPGISERALKSPETIRISVYTAFLLDLLSAQTRSGSARVFVNVHLNQILREMYEKLTGNSPVSPDDWGDE